MKLYFFISNRIQILIESRNEKKRLIICFLFILQIRIVKRR
jgi:hypothetical protein